MEIQHSLHQHPLVLRENSGNEQYTCHECRSHTETVFFYFCDQCRDPYFCLHYSCAVTLLEQINLPFHPCHPLTLFTECESDFTCPICKENHEDEYWYEPEHPNSSSYTCIECDFDKHLECAMLPTIICEGHDRIQPLCHLQPMKHVKKGSVSGDNGVLIKCFVCQSPIESDPAFSCTICKHFIHKSCTELPLEITQPFHPRCCLFLQVKHQKHTCRSCQKGNYTFIFRCNSHNFNMCIRCTSLRSTIKYEGHDHLLCFMELNKNPEYCDAYDSYCRKSIVVELLCRHRKEPYNMLRCVKCNFSIHLLCGPLPCTIKHKCHVHPLTPFDLVIEDDSGEYYCDACGMRRNPQLRVYYCAE